MPRPVAILAALCLAGVTAAAAELFEYGRWRVPVVLPAEPETDEWYAAQTLLDWCERVTGVRPELISEQPGVALPAARGLFVGRTAAWLALSRPLPDVDGDVLVRDVEGEAVFLLGTNPIATRATVGRFCEQALGVCFALPGPRGAVGSSVRRWACHPRTFPPRLRVARDLRPVQRALPGMGLRRRLWESPGLFPRLLPSFQPGGLRRVSGRL